MFFLLLIAWFQPAISDLPVHCLAKDFVGEWTFNIGKSGQTNSIACSHNHPDKNTDHIYNNFKSSFQIETQETFTLSFPNLVKNENKEILGNWTTIYDEGFEIRALNRVFFAFSKYIYRGNRNPKDEDDEQVIGYESLCNETFLGWYYDAETKENWGCFFAEKNEADGALPNVRLFKGASAIKPLKIVEKPASFLKNNEGVTSFYSRFLQKIPLYSVPHGEYMSQNEENSVSDNEDFFQPDYNFIEMVNNIDLNSPWKAKAHDNFVNKTHRHMKNLLGLTRFKELKLKNVLNSYNSHNRIFNEESLDDFSGFSFLQLGDNADEKDKLELPKSFDWRDQSGVNYDTPVEHQGECGSCYAVAALSSIESRIRILSNNTKTPKLSIAGVLSCNRYNQGCNGGYPELVAKFGMDHGFYEAGTCSDSIDSCQEECFSNNKLWKINSYGYVGNGYYGGTSEDSMMDEIYNRGPIVVAINAAPDLYYYSSGVFISNPVNSLKQENGNPAVKAWQFTNHAVVCIGWGESWHEGELLKYWILKNSWGSEWGENGYFKMLRGVNLGAVENQAIFANPKF